jgi:hypothetical protein
MLIGNQQFRDKNNLVINKLPEEKKIEWIEINQEFANKELVEQWLNNHFTFEQVREWIQIGFQTTEANFCTWIRDNKNKDAKWCLNCGSIEKLRKQFQEYQTQQIQNKIENYLTI